MDKKHYFREERTITALPDGRIRRIYVDKCREHEETEDLLEAFEKYKYQIHTITFQFHSLGTTP